MPESRWQCFYAHRRHKINTRKTLAGLSCAVLVGPTGLEGRVDARGLVPGCHFLADILEKPLQYCLYALHWLHLAVICSHTEPCFGLPM